MSFNLCKKCQVKFCIVNVIKLIYNLYMAQKEIKGGEIISTELEDLKYGYSIIAKNSEGQEIGAEYFSVKNGSCWLHKISVRDERYLNRGVGKVLIDSLEEFLCSIRVYLIEGEFSPEGFGAEFARNFYLKNGYEIYKNNNQLRVGKHLKHKSHVQSIQNL